MCYQGPIDIGSIKELLDGFSKNIDTGDDREKKKSRDQVKQC